MIGYSGTDDTSGLDQSNHNTPIVGNDHITAGQGKTMVIYVVAAIALLVTGIAIGVIAVVSLGVRREERAFTLTGDTRDPLARGARRLTGLYTRAPDMPRRTSRYRDDTLV